jgi:hypothetical protein
MRTVLLLFALLCVRPARTQVTQQGGWLFLSHTQTLDSRWSLLLDLQARSAHGYAYINTWLLRTAVSYNLNKQHAFALGYVYNRELDREAVPERTLDQRIFEQYLFRFRQRRSGGTIRARLEQRFIQEAGMAFAQRFRLMAALQVPLAGGVEFNRGTYLRFQEELFLNIQHREAVNNNWFDQNRPYVAVGYRFGEGLDAEIGYMLWSQQESNAAFLRHIVQLMFTTKF